MATIYDGYSEPAFVQVCPVSNGKAAHALANNSTPTHAVAYGQSRTFYPLFWSDYSGNATQQVQYRIRHRYNYASGLLVDDTGAEVWTEYPDWTDPSGATTSAPCTCGWSVENGKYIPSMGITFAYDISTYDMHEIEVRARTYSASTDRCSAWVYGTTRIAFVPRLTSYTAETLATGYTRVSFGTNWPRGGANLWLRDLLDEFDGRKRYLKSKYITGCVEGEAFLLGPDDRVTGNADILGCFWFESAYMTSNDFSMTDGVGYQGCDELEYEGGGYVIEPGAHVDPQDVPDPVLSVVSADSEQVVIGVECICDHVAAHVEYSDADGNRYSADMEPGGASPDWTVTLDAPPFGVAIAVKVAACNASGGYKLATETVTVASTSHCCLDGDGDHVELAYDGEFQQQTSLDGESVVCAGRKLPVARHGLAVSRTITVKGTIAFPSVFSWGDMEIGDLNVLDDPHDWIFRNPRGVRKRVRIASWDVSQDTGQLGRVAEVTIDMEEVG